MLKHKTKEIKDIREAILNILSSTMGVTQILTLQIIAMKRRALIRLSTGTVTQNNINYLIKKEA